MPAVLARWSLSEQRPEPEILVEIAREHRFRASSARLSWESLAETDAFPFLALLTNGNAVVVLGVSSETQTVRVLDPLARVQEPFELDRHSFESSWDGQSLLLQPQPGHSGLRCLVMVARHHGVDLSLEGLIREYGLEDADPSPDLLVKIAKNSGFKAAIRRLSAKDLPALAATVPFLALLADGRAVILAGIARAAVPDNEPGEVRVDVVDMLNLPVCRQSLPLTSLLERWDGTAVLIKRRFTLRDQDRPFGLGWFVPELLRQKRTFTDVALAAFMLSVLGLAMPLYFQIVVDKVLLHKSMSTLQVLSLGMLGVLAFEAGFQFLRGRLLLLATTAIDIRVSSHTFSKLLSLPLGFFGRSRVGVLIQHMQQADKIREFLTGKLFFTLLDCFTLAVFLPFLFFQSPTLAFLVVGFSLVLSLFLAVLIPLFRRRLLRLYKAEGERQAFLVETIQGMETVKSLSLEPQRRRIWDEKVAQAVWMRQNVGKVSVSATAGIGFMEKLMSLAIPWLGVFLVFENKLSVGGLIAFQMLAGRVSAPLVQIVSLIHEYQEKALSVRMLASVMDEPSERPPARGGVRPVIQGEIVFENVCFRYAPDAAQALSEVSVRFPAGRMVGVVGRSGSGKSTLGRLIQGLYYAESGIVAIDGQDMRECDLVHLRRHVGVVLQDSFLFTGTVRENIAIGRPSSTFNEMAWAASLAGADEFIRKLPHGYDTMLEENGSNLSGGQRQRLAIARALINQPRVLIFDEATSALDAESEEIIQDNLDKMALGRTIIMISHRLSMLARADTIVVMDQGRIVDTAPHAVLVERCPIYRGLWLSQNRHVLNPGNTPRLS